jgi:hypothetical protein
VGCSAVCSGRYLPKYWRNTSPQFSKMKHVSMRFFRNVCNTNQSIWRHISDGSSLRTNSSENPRISQTFLHLCKTVNIVHFEEYCYFHRTTLRCIPEEYHWGRAIAQAVSGRVPTAAAQVRAHVWSCGICGGQSGTGAGFLQVLRFPLPIRILPITPQSSSSSSSIGRAIA